MDLNVAIVEYVRTLTFEFFTSKNTSIKAITTDTSINDTFLCIFIANKSLFFTDMALMFLLAPAFTESVTEGAMESGSRPVRYISFRL